MGGVFHPWFRVWATQNCSTKTYEGDYRAAAMDTLETLRGVASISGELEIRGTKLMDLAPLSCLKSIRQGLVVSRNEALVSLHGLETLVEVGAEIQIVDNPKLESMQALGSLAEMGKNAFNPSFDVKGNPRLRALNLGRLGAVPGSLIVQGNAAIVDLTGLERLKTIGRQLWIVDNAALKSLGGTEGITAVATKPASVAGVIDLRIVGNSQLPQCQAKALLDRLAASGFSGRSEIENNMGACP
jgi:hypothetical protein